MGDNDYKMKLLVRYFKKIVQSKVDLIVKDKNHMGARAHIHAPYNKKMKMISKLEIILLFWREGRAYYFIASSCV